MSLILHLNDKKDLTKSSLIWLSVANVSIALFAQTDVSSYAETGKGADVFRVILTVFGVENTKGDVVAIAAVNDGEASKVKFLETEGFRPVSSNLSSLTMTPNPGSSAGILEYVATFP
jgi:hypothetical protein